MYVSRIYTCMYIVHSNPHWVRAEIDDLTTFLFINQEFLQEVLSYQPALDDVTHAEEALFSSDLTTIESCEPVVIRQAALSRRSSTPRPITLASPIPPVSTDWNIVPVKIRYFTTQRRFSFFCVLHTCILVQC